MAEPVQRVPADEVRRRVQAGEALLVCAYEDEGKYRRLRLEGSIPIQELWAREDALPRDAEIIFY